MNKIVQLTAAILLFTSFATQADVNFTLTNNSAQPIIVMGYANNNILILNDQPMQLKNVKTLQSNETLSTNIANGQLNLLINITGNNKKQYKYETTPSADNKDKILIWENSKLYPAADKHRIMGFIKTKTAIHNNVSMKEITQTE